MAITPLYKLVGPYSPKEFSDLTTLTTRIKNEVGTLNPGDTLVASDPIMILGNVFILVTYV